MSPLRSHFVTASQQLLALGVVLVALAPATRVVSLDVVAQRPGATQAAAVRGAVHGAAHGAAYGHLRGGGHDGRHRAGRAARHTAGLSRLVAHPLRGRDRVPASW